MNEKDPIKDLFQEALRDIEIPVKPEVWQAVSQSMGATTTSVTTGISMFSKILIGIASAGLISSGIIYFTSEKNAENASTLPAEHKNEIEQKKDIQPTVEESVNTKTLNTPNLSLEKTATNDNKVLQIEIPLREEMTSHPISESSVAPHSLPVATSAKVSPIINNETSTDTKHQAPVVKQSKVSDPINLPQESELNFILPNVFTPNGDGSNDELSLELPTLSEFSLAVLDTKGTAVFRTQNPEFKWNGEGMDGQKVPPGDYLYFITAKDAKGKAVSRYSRLSVRY
jgi:gliding motility-associated-like protein